MFNVRFFLKILLLLLICESISARAPVPEPPEPDPIRIAWMVYRDRENRRDDFNALENYLTNQIGRPVTIQTVDNYDYQSVLRRMSPHYRAGDRVDITFFTPYTYVLAHQENTKIKAFLTYKLEGGMKEYRCRGKGYLIVRSCHYLAEYFFASLETI